VVVQFDQIGRFSQIDSVKVQHLQQQVGESGALLQFTITGIISGQDACYGLCVGSDFYGVLSNGSVQGIWFSNAGIDVNGSSQGTFKLTS